MAFSFRIIVTNSKKDKEILEELFTGTKNLYIVSENWDSQGAGNGLGTLHGFLEACALAQREGINLASELHQGASIALYHTAGKGVRLFPLPLIEGSKSRVRLPSNETIIEAICRATAPFAATGKGRLSVFWGDSLFLPETIPMPTSDIALFTIQEPLIDGATYERDEWYRYGIVGVDAAGVHRQFEKLSRTQFEQLHPYFSSGFGKSLGCFSLSFGCLDALLSEFAEELTASTGHFDTDSDFWMPLVHDEALFEQLIPSKKEHFQRMQRFKKRWTKNNSTPLFEALNLGRTTHFYDFGSLKWYYHNILSLTKNSNSGLALLRFFALPQSPQAKQLTVHNSIIIDSEIEEGTISNSVIIGVRAKRLDIEKSVLLNSRLHTFQGSNTLLYNVDEEESYFLQDHHCRADIEVDAQRLKLLDAINNRPKEEWLHPVKGNPFSWEELWIKTQLAETVAAP